MSDLELNSTLIGITSNFELSQDEGFAHIKVIFDVARITFEDFSLIFESQKMNWEYMSVEFHVERFDHYNFADISLVFQVTRGLEYADIPFIFSVIKQPQSFMSYIFQKLYCVTSEITETGLEISDWNVSPNKLWYITIDSDEYDENMMVYLFDTLVDLNAGTNLVASGIIDPDTLTIVLYDTEDVVVPFYYTDYPYHLTVSEYPEYSAQFKINPLTDMSEIRHPIYNNSNIVLSKGEAELNLHTYAVLKKELVLGTHLPELEIGDTVEFVSTRRASTNNSQVLSQTISGEVSNDGESSLITTIRIANYLELSRQ